MDDKYEDRTGQPPNVRSMEEIPNVNGVTGYWVQWRRDHEGGRDVTEPVGTGWSKVDQFKVILAKCV